MGRSHVRETISCRFLLYRIYQVFQLSPKAPAATAIGFLITRSSHHLRAFTAQVGFFHDSTHLLGISAYFKFLEDVVDFFIGAPFDLLLE
jgi:hypothetical protein